MSNTTTRHQSHALPKNAAAFDTPVDVTSASNASTRTYFGGADRRA
jgi:hypothetical protein